MANPFERITEKAKAALAAARERSRAVDIAAATFQRFSDDDGGSYAAALTYYTFFSIFPLLLFAAAVLGYLTVDDPELRADLIKEGLKTVPIIRDAFHPDGVAAIIENRQTIAITALVLALYSGSGAVVALQHALNRIHGIEDEPGWVKKRLRSLMWLAVLGAGGILAIGVGTIAGFARDLLGDGATGTGAAVIWAGVGGVVITTALFATAYKFLPERRQRWGQVLPGAVVAAMLFQVLNLAGSLYLARGETARNDTFGTFAAAATLLVASYLISQITLLAAEVNLVLAEGKDRRAAQTKEEAR